MKKYTVVADPRVVNDLKEASDFLNSKRKGFGTKFLTEYRAFLKTLQSNPDFQVRYKDIHCLPLKTFKYMVHFTINKKLNLYIFLMSFRHIKTQTNIGYKNKSIFFWSCFF